MINETEKKLIEAKIAEIETKTQGEIKVIVTQSSPKWKWGNLTPVRNKALFLFKKHQLHKTIERTGVLILLSLKEREFYVYADKGVYQKIGQETLHAISQQLEEDMQAKKYCEGILRILDSIAIPLIQFFPIKEGDINEICNSVRIEK